MAPYASDSKDLTSKSVLNPARRRALAILLGSGSSKDRSRDFSTSLLPSPTLDPGAEAWEPLLRTLLRTHSLRRSCKSCRKGPGQLRPVRVREKEWAAARNPAPPPYSAVSSDVNDMAAEAKAEARDTQKAQDVLLLQSQYTVAIPSHPDFCASVTVQCADKGETKIAQTLLPASIALTADAEIQKW
ncbi:YSIRK family gram-positive signal peptide [Diplocarpon rosae]|nr:YSIRK family gram-positive signal peptide [Diplocarpon rosae]